MVLSILFVPVSAAAVNDSPSPIVMLRSDPGNPIETAVEAVTSSTSVRSISSWTVIVYLDGDNNLGYYMQKDLTTLTSASSDSNIKIVVLFDQSGSRDSAAYYLSGGGQSQISLSSISSSWSSEVNMGDPNTLVKFADYCIDHYPSEHYLLVLQDHGGAWQGCCWDETSGSDRLTLSELGSAFEAIKDHLGRKIDVTLFNSCLMSNMEVLCRVQGCTDYVVASESIGWTSNWDDEWGSVISWMKADPDRTPEEVAICLANACQLTDSGSYVTQSVAAMNMTYLPVLKNQLANLSARVVKWMSADGGYVLTARAACGDFMGPYTGETDRLIDLYQFIYELKGASSDPELDSICESIMGIIGPSGGSLGSMVLVHRCTTSTSFSHGISIYFPSTSIGFETDYYEGNILASSTQWDEMVIGVRSFTGGDAAISVNSDAELASQASAKGWNGAGTASSPYIITGLSISATNGACILLGNIT